MKRSRVYLILLLSVTAVAIVLLQIRVRNVPSAFALGGSSMGCTPELSAGAAVSGISLMVGAALVVLDHYRRRRKHSATGQVTQQID